MKFASPEIRAKAVHAYLAGKATARQLADILGYTPATICNWVRAYKTNEQLAARANGHRKSCFSDEELRQLAELLSKQPDLTLEQIKEHFGKNCTLSALHRIILKLGFVYRKDSRGKKVRMRK